MNNIKNVLILFTTILITLQTNCIKNDIPIFNKIQLPNITGVVPIYGMIETDTNYTFNCGSAVIAFKIKNHYYAITAKHIVKDTHRILIDNTLGKVIVNFNHTDISMIEFKSNKKYPIYPFGKPKLGEEVWGIGYPKGLNPFRNKRFICKGNVCYISNKEIWYNGGGANGMSGGALLNKKGELLGIASNILVSNPSPISLKRDVYYNFMNFIPLTQFELGFKLTISEMKKLDQHQNK